MSDDLAGHLPDRPSFNCLSCGKPWPCDPAREHLAASMTSTPLTLYMYAFFEQATAQEPPPAPAGELYERMLAWTRVRPTTG